MHQDTRNIEEYDLRNFNHRKLKREVIAKFGKIDEGKSLIKLVLQHLSLFCHFPDKLDINIRISSRWINEFELIDCCNQIVKSCE